jgi:hypothetical protein
VNARAIIIKTATGEIEDSVANDGKNKPGDRAAG